MNVFYKRIGKIEREEGKELNIASNNNNNNNNARRKETYEYLGILEDDIIKEVEMKEKNTERISQREPESHLRQNYAAKTLKKKTKKNLGCTHR